MLLYTMLYIVLAYLMLFAALTNSVCLNNASFFFLFKYFLCQGYELSGEIALKNNHYYYYYYISIYIDASIFLPFLCSVSSSVAMGSGRPSISFDEVLSMTVLTTSWWMLLMADL